MDTQQIWRVRSMVLEIAEVALVLFISPLLVVGVGVIALMVVGAIVAPIILIINYTLNTLEKGNT